MPSYIRALGTAVMVSSVILFGAPGPAAANTAAIDAPNKSAGQGKSAQPGPSIQAQPSEPTIIEVGSKAGWVQVPLALTQGKQYTLRAAGSWTVDYRNFPKVGPAGYNSATDKTIYQGCKIGPYPYARLLGKIGNGQPFSVGEASVGTNRTNDALFLRINDADACLGDNDGSVFVGVTTGSNDSTPPPLVTREDIKKALLCGLSVAKERISDKDLRHAITLVLLGRDLAEVRNNLEKFFLTLGIGLAPFDKCLEPYINPPPVH